MTTNELTYLQTIGVVGGILIPAWEFIFKKTEKKGLAKISNIGWVCFGFAIYLIVVGYFSNNVAENEKIERDKKDHIRDSLADIRIIKSNKSILNGIGEAIGKYSLGYDSAKKEIEALKKLIKDSANRKTTIIQGENPVLKFNTQNGLALTTIRNDSLLYTITIRSYSASSILKKGTIYILCSSNQNENIFNDLLYIGMSPIFTKGLNFYKNETQTGHLNLVGENINLVKTIVVLVRINFTDSNGKNMPNIEEIGILDIINNQFNLMAAPYDDKVIEILKKKTVLK